MKNIRIILPILSLFLISHGLFGQASVIDVKSFDEVSVNSNIQVTFMQGDDEAVRIESLELERDKLNIEVKGGKLHLYLEGTRPFGKNKKRKNANGRLYNKTMAKLIVTYRELNELTIKGDELIVLDSHVDQEQLRMKVYGDSKVVLNSVALDKLHVSLYGDNEFKVESGSIGYQKYNTYGDSEIDTQQMNAQNSWLAKVASYGDCKFLLSVSNKIKITALGDASVSYLGNPKINKGLVLGEMTVKKND